MGLFKLSYKIGNKVSLGNLDKMRKFLIGKDDKETDKK